MPLQLSAASNITIFNKQSRNLLIAESNALSNYDSTLMSDGMSE